MRILFSSIIFVLVIVALFFLGAEIIQEMETNGTPGIIATSTPVTNLEVGTTTLVGEFVCLPHRDTSGPQTMECAYGMKTNDGIHYGMDLSKTHISSFDLPMGRQYSVTGILVPIENLSTDYWQKYNIRGIMQVSSYEEKMADIPILPVNSKITLELKKPVIVASTTIRISALTEDSRCPSDVRCIQAGRAMVMYEIDSPSGPSIMQAEVGKTVTTETLSITLIDVRPYPISTRKTTDEEYRFDITVNRK